MSNVKCSENQSNKCGICQPSDEETKLIQEGLLQRLKGYQEKLKLSEQALDQQTEESLGFHRLIKIIFHKKYKNFKMTTCCKHYELKREFAAKLKCSFKVLDIISQKISNGLAKYSFHTDVVSQQVKTFPRHFFNEKNYTPKKKEEAKEKTEKESTEKKTQKIEPNGQEMNGLQNTKTAFGNDNVSYVQNPMMMSPFLNGIYPQDYSQMCNPMNFSWGFPFANNSNNQGNRPN